MNTTSNWQLKRQLTITPKELNSRLFNNISIKNKSCQLSVMKKTYYKVEQNYEYMPKRNVNLITPCCNKPNKDGKFVNYKHFPDIYGYCHSCGRSSFPPRVYRDDKGDEYIWNDIKKIIEPLEPQMYYNNSELYHKSVIQRNTIIANKEETIKYVPKSVVLRCFDETPENNLICYIRNTYGDKSANKIKKLYYIGTNKDGGTVFWNINILGKAQKAKISYYNLEGKRYDRFKVPYKNEDGYYSCLFGEHLISKTENKTKIIILVESEKTAIIGAIHLPNYIWLSYGGINGLTKEKMNVLIGYKILIIPDMSENAVEIMNKRITYLIKLGIDARIWDMTNGKSDEQLKDEGWYNCDLEDVFRRF